MSGDDGRLGFEPLEASPACCSADGCELQAIGLRFGRPWCLSHAPLYDPVGRPRHYQSASGLEAIDVVEGFGLGFLLGNVVKYVLRAAAKSGVEDLRKARWYLDRAVKTDRRQAIGDRRLPDGAHRVRLFADFVGDPGAVGWAKLAVVGARAAAVERLRRQQEGQEP